MFKSFDDNYGFYIVTPKPSDLVKLPNLDKLRGFNHAGLQALISADTKAEPHFFVPALAEMNPAILKKLNLYESKDKNEDPTIRGYFNNKGIVRAIRLKQNVSNAFMFPVLDLFETPLELPADIQHEQFNEVDDLWICRKYKPPVPIFNLTPYSKVPAVDRTYIPIHVKTVQLYKVIDELNPQTKVTVSQKLHGTSVILGNTIIPKKKTFWSKVSSRFLPEEPESYVFGYVASSRQVIKSAPNLKAKHNHFYGSDVWSSTLERYKYKIPKGFLIYGEIIGWIGETPIQKDYTYDIPKGLNELYVYRVATVSPDGLVADLTHSQLISFCQSQGFKYVPTYHTNVPFESIDMKFFEDRVHSESFSNALPLSNKGTVDEGVVIRIEEYPTPTFLKYKSPKFYEYEYKTMEESDEILE